MMSSWLHEKRITCPFCGETISIIVDTSTGSQSYIEDCEICCRAMQITLVVADDELVSVSADA